MLEKGRRTARTLPALQGSALRLRRRRNAHMSTAIRTANAGRAEIQRASPECVKMS